MAEVASKPRYVNGRRDFAAEIAAFDENANRVVSFLNHSFGEAAAHLRRSDKLIGIQREYCYLVDEIQRGPICMAQKRISEANDFIKRLADIKP